MLRRIYLFILVKLYVSNYHIEWRNVLSQTKNAFFLFQLPFIIENLGSISSFQFVEKKQNESNLEFLAKWMIVGGCFVDER